MKEAIRCPSWALLLWLLISTTASAQDIISISGTVTTRADGLSVAGAVVTVLGVDVQATTDANGRYSLQVPRDRLRGERIQVRVDALGLPGQTAEAVVSEAILTVDVALSLAFTEHVTVGSRASAAEAERAGPVDIITREQIAASGYAETAQLIQSLTPSFNVPRPTITDGTDTVSPRNAARPGPRSGARARERQAPSSGSLVHLNNSIGRGLDRRGFQRHPHFGDRSHRGAARRRLGGITGRTQSPA